MSLVIYSNPKTVSFSPLFEYEVSLNQSIKYYFPKEGEIPLDKLEKILAHIKGQSKSFAHFGDPLVIGVGTIFILKGVSLLFAPATAMYKAFFAIFGIALFFFIRQGSFASLTLAYETLENDAEFYLQRLKGGGYKSVELQDKPEPAQTYILNF